MDKQEEYNSLIKHIPQRNQYSQNAELQINIPTNSKIQLGDTIKIIQNNAHRKGWKTEEVTVIKTGGYIVCEDCKKSLHIHITTGIENHCINCGHEHSKRITKAEIRVVDK